MAGMVVDGVNNGCSTLVRELAGWERQDGEMRLAWTDGWTIGCVDGIEIG